MYPFNKTFILIIGMAFLTGMQACQDGHSRSENNNARLASNSIINKIPKLLDRQESLRNGAEWGHVQNLYGKSRAELLKDPAAKEPWLGLAEIFIQEARVTGEHPHYYGAALQMLDILLATNLDEKNLKEQDLKFRALGDKANVELSLHEFGKALETGRQALAMNPYNASIYGVLVDANVELGNYEEAVKMADKMVSIRPDLRSYSRVSYLREIYGDLDGSIEAMEMAVTAGYPGQEQTAWARLTLGHLYQQAGKPKEAETQFLTALEERPDYPFAIAALADLAVEKKEFEKAEALLNKAAAIIPEVSFYESLAKVYRATGRDAESGKTIQTVIAMMEDDAAHGHNMDLEFAKVYSDLLGDQQQALKSALKELERRPENMDVNGMLASIYAKMGDQVNSRKHLEKAMRTGG